MKSIRIKINYLKLNLWALSQYLTNKDFRECQNESNESNESLFYFGKI